MLKHVYVGYTQALHYIHSSPLLILANARLPDTIIFY